MKDILDFLEKLTNITKQTGIIIDTLGDPFYNPMLAYRYQMDEQDNPVWFSYDVPKGTYVARVGNPYDGEVIFPPNHPEAKNTSKHHWYTCDNGFGIECDKCGAYINMLTDVNFFEKEKREDCPVPDEEEIS